MADKILCVDDDPNILAAYTRSLRKAFTLNIAESGQEGLKKIKSSGPYAVVVSDMQMPGMDGVQFLSKVSEISPDTTRLMLTGQGDLKVAMDAVNKGNIFRFLTKPCPPKEMALALEAGLEQHNLKIAEKVLLEETLKGSVKVLSEVLSMVNPVAFGRASRVRRTVRKLMTKLGLPISWKIEIGSMLSMIGCVIVPQDTLQKVFDGRIVEPEEQKMLDSHPFVGRDLLKKIPRMDEISEMIAYQDKGFDGSGLPRNGNSGGDIILGARLLKIALDFDTLKTNKLTAPEAVSKLEESSRLYDPKILTALKDTLDRDVNYEVKSLRIADLSTSMLLEEDVISTHGTLLLANGQEVTRSLLLRLKNFAVTTGVREPIMVLVPIR